MNRREMLVTGFRQLAQALPGLVTRRKVSTLTGSASAPPHREALSFPQKPHEVDDPAQKSPVKED